MGISSTDKREVETIARKEIKSFLNTTQAHDIVIRVIQKELGTRKIEDRKSVV